MMRPAQTRARVSQAGIAGRGCRIADRDSGARRFNGWTSGQKRGARGLGNKSLSGAIRKAISVLLRDEWIEYTVPEKPTSRSQKYQLTLAGERALKERFGEEDR